MSPHVVDRLSAYMDGELTVADAAEVRLHLAACEPCGRELALLASVDRGLRARSVEGPPGYFDSFSTRVRTRIETQGRAPRSFRLPAWSWAAAAAVLLAVIAPRLLRDAPRAGEPSYPVPSSAAAPVEQAAPPVLSPPKAQTTPDAGGAAVATRSDEKRRHPLPAPAAARPEAGGFAATPAPLAAEVARRPEAKDMTELDAASTRAASVDPMAAGQPAAAADEAEAGGKGEAAKTDAPAPPTLGVAAEGRVVEKKSMQPGAPARLRSRTVVQAEFASLRARVAASVEEMRALRDAWRSFVKRHPQTAEAAEARVLMVGLGVDIAQATGSAQDAEEARRDGAEALAHGDLHQQQRVQSLLDRQEPK